MTVEINRAYEIACDILNGKPRQYVRFAEPDRSESPRPAPEWSEGCDDGGRAPSPPPRYWTSHGQNGYSQNDHSEDYYDQDDYRQDDYSQDDYSQSDYDQKDYSDNDSSHDDRSQRNDHDHDFAFSSFRWSHYHHLSDSTLERLDSAFDLLSDLLSLISDLHTQRIELVSTLFAMQHGRRVFNSIETLHAQLERERAALDRQLRWEYDPDADREGWTLDALIEDGDGSGGGPRSWRRGWGG